MAQNLHSFISGYEHALQRLIRYGLSIECSMFDQTWSHRKIIKYVIFFFFKLCSKIISVLSFISCLSVHFKPYHIFICCNMCCMYEFIYTVFVAFNEINQNIFTKTRWAFTLNFFSFLKEKNLYIFINTICDDKFSESVDLTYSNSRNTKSEFIAETL